MVKRLKGILRSQVREHIKALEEAITSAFKQIIEEDLWNWFLLSLPPHLFEKEDN